MPRLRGSVKARQSEVLGSFEAAHVTTGDDNSEEQPGRGFAGLSSMLSDVDASASAASKGTPRDVSDTASERNTVSPRKQAKTPPSPPPFKPHTEPSVVPSLAKWVLGIAAVLGVLWLVGIANENSPPQSNARSPSVQTGADRTVSAYSAPPEKPETPSMPVMAKPPIGQDLVLSRSQIRYCIAEDIWLDSAKAVLNNYINSDVDRYNAAVADRNSRCGQYRYRSGDLENARQDINPYRNQFQANARLAFTHSEPSRDRSAPSATIRDVQGKLNLLGYDAGAADGVMGSKTRAAIASFQRDLGLVVDGRITQALLIKLGSMPSAAPTSHQTTNTNERTSSPQGSESITPSVTSLSYDERSAIQAACIMKQSQGVASYNRCLTAQLRELSNAPREPDLSGLSYDEKSAIQTACIMKQTQGVASYNRCVVAQIKELADAPREPSMDGLTYDEKSAIQAACIMKQTQGVASYNRCLVSQLRKLSNGPREPDMSGLSYNEKSSIQTACIMKQTQGAASYNRCLIAQLRSIGR